MGTRYGTAWLLLARCRRPFRRPGCCGRASVLALLPAQGGQSVAATEIGREREEALRTAPPAPPRGTAERFGAGGSPVL